MADLEMATAATKLRPPAAPTRLVERTRLAAVLDHGIDSGVPLLLVSAQAGSGKSTLVASWAAGRGEAAAWLQVEDGDSDPARFWSSIVTAIGRLRPEFAARLTPAVIGSQGDDRVVVTAIVNELVGTDERLVVVIDDYHLIDEASVHRGVERLVDLCPPQLTLVIITRVDPPFRLGRMRVRGRMSEVRAHDLRFDTDEASALLGAVSARLSVSALDDLCARTEGWAAGLVLAGLSIERAPDPDRFVAAFRGDDQLVVGYLSDELLSTMGAGDRQRLLETALLDRLTGPLVDGVTASSGGREWLTRIADRNQLVIRLDSTGEWFRYHHLLRDLLSLEARQSFPERIPELHARAAAWFEAQSDHEQAVVHRLAGGDLPGAISLMHIVAPRLIGRGQIATVRRLLEQIGAVAESSTACALSWGWCEYLEGRYAEAQRWLDTALRVAPAGFDRTITTPLSINVALGRGDVASALDTARNMVATDQLDSHPTELSTATGAAFVWAGLTDEGKRVLESAIAKSKLEQRPAGQVLALVYIAIAELEDGDANAAHGAATKALATADSFGLSAYHGVAQAYAIRARTANSEQARADVKQALEIVRRASTDLGLAYVLTACGDTLIDLGDAAGPQLISEARRVIDRCVDPGIAGRYLARVESRHRLSQAPVDRAPSLVEPLTKRELSVLRYLPTKLSLRQIASEMYVSLNTVKTHCGAVYRKLGVSDRKSAVDTARKLGLL
ncbi:MAG TPA: LuxR C-terminal-related transcriptional regulator [Ilumatobacter sp.]|nr:LuxR C-terminal-related transcriptional regulator [Ilumatobacter sp.]